MATNGMLESRIKIQQGIEKELSMQHRLDCNFANEGCAGGWGFFDSIFIEHFGAVDESCAPFLTVAKPDGCAKWAKCPTVASVKDIHYIGLGSYG